MEEKKVQEGFETSKKRNEEKDNRDVKKIVSRVVSIILWILLFTWMGIVLIDYFHVHNEEAPQFCMWNKKTTNYSDGKVTECNGLGYKIIDYKREDFNALEFGPFWIKDRTAKTK